MVISPQSDKVMCSLPATNTGDGESFSLDASGRLLGHSNGAGKRMDFYEIPSGRPAGHFDGRADEVASEVREADRMRLLKASAGSTYASPQDGDGPETPSAVLPSTSTCRSRERVSVSPASAGPV